MSIRDGMAFIQRDADAVRICQAVGARRTLDARVRTFAAAFLPNSRRIPSAPRPAPPSSSSSRIFFSAIAGAARSGELVSRKRYSSCSKRDVAEQRRCRSSRWSPAKMITTCFSTGSGWYCGCFRISTSRWPRCELRLRRLVEVAAELRERRELAVLREVETQRAGHLPHRLDLRRAADARHRVADVDGRPDALVEQVATRGRSGRR